MKKGDLFSGSGLEWYAELGLIIFVLAFIAIVIRVVFMKKNQAESLKSIPLDDDILSEERLNEPVKSGKEATQ